MFSKWITPENGSEPENGGWIGLKRYFQFGPDDVFNEPGRVHDDAYEGRTVLTQYEADRLFLLECLEIAGTSHYLKARAWFFYGMVLFAKVAGLSTWRGRT